MVSGLDASHRPGMTESVIASAAKPSIARQAKAWIASSLSLLAMTGAAVLWVRNDGEPPTPSFRDTPLFSKFGTMFEIQE
jgi:hypothetical protein